MNTAVIDIGSNTLLLLIVDEGRRRVVDLCRFGRLGKGLDASGRLDPQAIARSLEICREYRAVMDQHGVGAPHIIATQALREAGNASDFAGPAEQILGGKIEIIGGSREAELAYKSVAHTFIELAHAPFAVVDVGGASTEIIAAASGSVVSAVSVPIGAVRMTERHLKTDPPTSDEIRALDDDIDAHLGKLALPANVPLVGTAGTATTMASFVLALSPYDPDAVTGIRLAPDKVDEVRRQLFAATTAARKKMAGIEPERADVIAGGVAIYHRVMKKIGAPVMITCDRGIRWGLAYELVR